MHRDRQTDKSEESERHNGVTETEDRLTGFFSRPKEKNYL